MISFKQFIIEARMAPLYHKTDLDSFYSILQNKQIAALTTHNGYSKYGVSLTRDIRTAFKWRRRSAGVVIEIDHQKLIQNKRIKPINIANVWYPQGGGHSKTEELFEEFVEGPIEEKYFTRYIVPEETLKTTNISDNGNLLRIVKEFPFVKVYSWKDKKQIKLEDIRIKYDW